MSSTPPPSRDAAILTLDSSSPLSQHTRRDSADEDDRPRLPSSVFPEHHDPYAEMCFSLDPLAMEMISHSRTSVVAKRRDPETYAYQLAVMELQALGAIKDAPKKRNSSARRHALKKSAGAYSEADSDGSSSKRSSFFIVIHHRLITTGQLILYLHLPKLPQTYCIIL